MWKGKAVLPPPVALYALTRLPRLKELHFELFGNIFSHKNIKQSCSHYNSHHPTILVLNYIKQRLVNIHNIQ